MSISGPEPSCRLDRYYCNKCCPLTTCPDGQTLDVGLDVHRATRIGSAGHGGQILLSEATRQRIESRLPPDTTVQRLGAYGLKGLPGLETISQLAVPDLPAAFPPLRLETPVRVTD